MSWHKRIKSGGEGGHLVRLSGKTIFIFSIAKHTSFFFFSFLLKWAFWKLQMHGFGGQVQRADCRDCGVGRLVECLPNMQKVWVRFPIPHKTDHGGTHM